jgi:hypothetical protein
MQHSSRRLSSPASPATLNEGDGAGPTDGTESLEDTALSSGVAEVLRGELSALVGNEMARNTEATNSPFK